MKTYNEKLLGETIDHKLNFNINRNNNESAKQRGWLWWRGLKF